MAKVPASPSDTPRRAGWDLPALFKRWRELDELDNMEEMEKAIRERDLELTRRRRIRRVLAALSHGMVITLLTVLPSIANADETRFYNRNGVYQGRAQYDLNGSDTRYYDRNGIYQGRAQYDLNGGDTRYYDRNGIYKGSTR